MFDRASAQWYEPVEGLDFRAQGIGCAPHAGGLAVGHVHVGPQLAEHALLPGARAELVADDRVAVVARLNAGVRDLLALGAADERHLLHHRRLLALQAVLLHPPCGRVDSESEAAWGVTPEVAYVGPAV